MIKAIKLRIFPNDIQRIQVHDTIGCSRFIFNQMLAERKEVYEQLKDDEEALYDYKYKTETDYKKEYPFLKRRIQLPYKHQENTWMRHLITFTMALAFRNSSQRKHGKVTPRK